MAKDFLKVDRLYSGKTKQIGGTVDTCKYLRRVRDEIFAPCICEGVLKIYARIQQSPAWLRPGRKRFCNGGRQPEKCRNFRGLIKKANSANEKRKL